MTPTRPWRPPTLASGNPVTSITERQADVLAGICHGHSNSEIGSRLRITEDTVKSHVKAILRALAARDRANAAALASSGQITVHVRDTSAWRAA
jgi:DNA-binding NarL/FixJ family response regulator